MTIHNQQPQPKSQPPLLPPADASPARPMPAKVYQQQRAEQGEESPTSPLSSQEYKEQPPLAPTGRAPRRKRRMRAPVVALLLVLVGLVGVGSVLAPRFFSTGSGSSGGTTIQGATPGGPFVRPPLSSTQVDAIMHLSGYMKDKALASLYVSHMTLDELLGQLIMVEYGDGCGSSTGSCPNATSYYSSDLDTMITTLHAGGVIMYEFQMQNFNQTKNDLTQMQKRATIPLLISADEEGGPYVHRLSHIDGYRMSATDIANSGNVDVATQQGAKTAHDLLALGINEDLAPDV